MGYTVILIRETWHSVPTVIDTMSSQLNSFSTVLRCTYSGLLVHQSEEVDSIVWHNQPSNCHFFLKYHLSTVISTINRHTGEHTAKVLRLRLCQADNLAETDVK